MKKLKEFIPLLNICVTHKINEFHFKLITFAAEKLGHVGSYLSRAGGVRIKCSCAVAQPIFIGLELSADRTNGNFGRNTNTGFPSRNRVLFYPDALPKFGLRNMMSFSERFYSCAD